MNDEPCVILFRIPLEASEVGLLEFVILLCSQSVISLLTLLKASLLMRGNAVVAAFRFTCAMMLVGVNNVPSS